MVLGWVLNNKKNNPVNPVAILSKNFWAGTNQKIPF
jgi:hypothetical protein